MGARECRKCPLKLKKTEVRESETVVTDTKKKLNCKLPESVCFIFKIKNKIKSSKKTNPRRSGTSRFFFTDELPFAFSKMHGFSTVDGFVEITESLAEMIKYVANEPSVGLFYIQQHTQNAVPNLVNLKSNVVEKSRETGLHTEDLEDSVCMVRSMKECGFSIADDMIRDIRKSLSVMSTKQPKRGLIQKPTFSFQMGRTSSWGPVVWGRGSVHDPKGDEQNSSYFSNVLKSARQKAINFKWPQPDSIDITLAPGEKLLPNPTPPLSVASASTSSSRQDMEVGELPVSSQVADELRVEKEAEEEEKEGKEKEVAVVSLSHNNLSMFSEIYDDFRADKEAKLEEWLEGTNGNPENVKSASDT
ncbi:hypothetical protein CUMW_157330 [Citrus unshiu]|nr:hypothetical protein CUMW_157330 [Citrus unshiu]